MTNSPTLLRPDVRDFTDKANATERTLRALANVGFTVIRDTDTIEGESVSTFHHSPVPYRYGSSDKKPEIAAIYTDPDTGNKVLLGMDIAGDGSLRWPYDWSAKTIREHDGTELAGGGNHDNNQGELVRQLTNLLAAAHFDKPSGYVGDHTPGYTEWAANIVTRLDPIYSDSLGA